MSTNYKIVGADGQQYGPITAEQIRQWIAEGRVDSRTAVFPDGAKDWTFAGLLPEFAALFPAGTPPAVTPLQARKTSGFATAGMVCGSISWIMLCCCAGLPFNILGLIFSLIGLSQINGQPERYEGRGQAIAGLVLSILSLLLGIGLFIWSAATGNFHYNWNVNRF